MFQPDELKKNEPLLWSTGTGTDVWRMFCAAKQGDVKTIEALLQTDPSLRAASMHTARRSILPCGKTRSRPPRFCSTAAQIRSVSHSRTAWSKSAATGATPLMEGLLESKLASVQGRLRTASRSPRRSARATWRRCEGLLDASPELLHAGDGRSNQPIHWAVMTRQLEMIDELLARGADINARRLRRCAADSAHQRRLQLSRLARCAGRRYGTPAEVLAHLLARGRFRRHLHGREHR